MTERQRMVLLSMVPCWIVLLAHSPGLGFQAIVLGAPNAGVSTCRKRTGRG